MMNEKARVFVAARKRGIDPARVRALLRAHGAPPTLAEAPARHETYRWPVVREGGWHDIFLSRRPPSDARDISRDLADLLIRLIMDGRP